MSPSSRPGRVRGRPGPARRIRSRASSGPNARVSPRCPAVVTRASGRDRRSASRWIWCSARRGTARSPPDPVVATGGHSHHHPCGQRSDPCDRHRPLCAPTLPRRPLARRPAGRRRHRRADGGGHLRRADAPARPWSPPPPSTPRPRRRRSQPAARPAPAPRCRRPTSGDAGTTPSPTARTRWAGPATAPRCGCAQHPVDHPAVIAPPATPPRSAVGQQRLQQRPLRIGQIMTILHTAGLPAAPPKTPQPTYQTGPRCGRPPRRCGRPDRG